jgi:hypothetical protein
MKLSNFLTEAKRGDRIYVIFDVSTTSVISATDNVNKLLEIVNRATKDNFNMTSLARMETRGQDDFGKGSNKVIVFKTVML